uniref:Cupin type-1 domain-containing protein n=1 Tax=Ananas comosus var. bracteatus TaxID=296719 RepID=A0A6V7PJU1_ANACO|nr:unnamed protein product [Ananas comosus var. bracteatus]
MATSSALLCSSLCLLFLFRGSLAQFGFGFGQSQGMSPWQSPRRFGGWGGQCRLDRLDVMEPTRRMQFEAGRIEYFDETNEQLRCAGLFAKRIIMEPRGLLQPSYANAPACSTSSKARRLHLSLAVHPSVCLFVCPCSSTDRRVVRARGPRTSTRRFTTSARETSLRCPPALLTGATTTETPPSSQSKSSTQAATLINSTLDSGSLIALDVKLPEIPSSWDRKASERTTDANLRARVQREIVRVEHGLHLMRPSFGEQQPPMEAEEEMERREQRGCPSTNGLDETYCTMKIKENINEASRADIYNPQGGRITYVNTQKLPILNLVQMSAARGVLRRNAMLAPLWSINAHSVMFVTQGHARIQVVNNQGRTVFDGEVRRNQLLVIPQNYAVIMRGREGCEWVSFKTNSNAMVSQIAGKASAFRGMPMDVLMNSYRLSREEALRLKFNRGDEMGIFAPKFQRAWSFAEEWQSQSQRMRVEHQQIHRFREGDISARPAAVSHWCYNDGDSPVVAIQVLDTRNKANQLDPRLVLEGFRKDNICNSLESTRQAAGNNILSGFDIEMLEESLGVNREVARRIQSKNDQRGEISRVEYGLHLMRPSSMAQQQEEEGEMQRGEWRGTRRSNRLDKTYCTMRMKANINNPSHADMYKQRGERRERYSTIEWFRRNILHYEDESEHQQPISCRYVQSTGWKDHLPKEPKATSP